MKNKYNFQNGDFVKIKDNCRLKDTICILEYYDPEKEYDENDENKDIVRVGYIYGAGRFGHDHVDINQLEPITIEREYVNQDPYKLLLLCCQSLIKGKGGLNDLQFALDRYRFVYYKRIENKRKRRK